MVAVFASYDNQFVYLLVFNFGRVSEFPSSLYLSISKTIVWKFLERWKGRTGVCRGEFSFFHLGMFLCHCKIICSMFPGFVGQIRLDFSI